MIAWDGTGDHPWDIFVPVSEINPLGMTARTVIEDQWGHIARLTETVRSLRTEIKPGMTWTSLESRLKRENEALRKQLAESQK